MLHLPLKSFQTWAILFPFSDDLNEAKHHRCGTGRRKKLFIDIYHCFKWMQVRMQTGCCLRSVRKFTLKNTSNFLTLFFFFIFFRSFSLLSFLLLTCNYPVILGKLRIHGWCIFLWVKSSQIVECVEKIWVNGLVLTGDDVCCYIGANICPFGKSFKHHPHRLEMTSHQPFYMNISRGTFTTKFFLKN